MRSGVRTVSASATSVVPLKSLRTMSLATLSALAKTSMARTPSAAPTVNGPFWVSQPPSSGGSVPESCVVGGAAAAASPSLSTRLSRASTVPLRASTKTR